MELDATLGTYLDNLDLEQKANDASRGSQRVVTEASRLDKPRSRMGYCYKTVGKSDCNDSFAV